MDPILAVAIADKGVDIADKAVDVVGKGMENFDKHKEQEQQRKNNQQNVDLDIIERKVEIGEMILEKAPDAINNAGNATVALIEAATKIWEATFKKIKFKDIGSKVKEGLFAECSIDDVGEVRIIIDEKHENDILLTSDTVKECRYLKEKERLVGLKKKMYFYYKITFKNDKISYIRISNKYREILEKDLQVIYD